MPLLLLTNSLKWTVNWNRETKYFHGNVKSRQLFSVSSIWEEKSQINLSYKTFSNQSKLAEKPKRKEKKPLGQSYRISKQSELSTKKAHPGTTKWELSSCWSFHISVADSLVQRPRADSTEKIRPKPKYHKLSQESLESI